MHTADQFRQALDQLEPRFDRSTPIPEIKSILGIGEGNNYSARWVSDSLERCLAAAFTSGRRRVWDQCESIRQELLHDHFANGLPLDPYYEVVRHLQQSTRGTTDVSEIQSDWKDALQAALELSVWSGRIFSHNLELTERGAVWQAHAASRTRNIGRIGRCDRVEPTLSTCRHAAIAHAVDRAAMKMGGIEVAKRLAAEMAPTFDSRMQRYHHVNRFAAGGVANEARLPANYLFQLCAKYPKGKKPLRKSNADWLALRQLSVDYAALHDVQPVNMMWALKRDALTHTLHLRELALHDSLFTLQQTRLSDALMIICGLIDSLRIQSPRVSAAAIGRLDEVAAVAHAVATICGIRRGPITFAADAVLREVATVAKSRVVDILNTVFSHPTLGANSKYSFPTELPSDDVPIEQRVGSNFGNKPLLHIEADRYLVLESAICAPALVEAVLTEMRTQAVSENMIGDAIEPFLVSAFAHKRIATKVGNYETSEGNGECDLVVETDTHIVFIEVKKKSLTRAARAGSDVALLKDLVAGMISPMLQAGWHEYRLRKFGSLRLTHAGRATEVELRGRSIERIAIALQDYGSFQDRSALDRIMTEQLSAQFVVAAGSPHEPAITRVNEKLRELQQLNESLYEQCGRPESWHPFVSCGFLSVPQLLLLLDSSTDAESFVRELLRNKPRWPGQIPPPVATPNSPRQDARIMTTRG